MKEIRRGVRGCRQPQAFRRYVSQSNELPTNLREDSDSFGILRLPLQVLGHAVTSKYFLLLFSFWDRGTSMTSCVPISILLGCTIGNFNIFFAQPLSASFMIRDFASGHRNMRRKLKLELVAKH